MSDIHKMWKSKEVTAKQAMDMIGEELKTADKKKQAKLMALASKILDAEVPMAEVDAEADEKWWKQTHPEADTEE